ncbi:MAG: lipid-A-disaccharide synthase [Bacteroidota bacterium]
MRYYIIAGEASGDLHASNLMREIALLDKMADFRCWGGDKMQARGGLLVKHYRDLAFMGFAEVVAHLPTIMRNFSFCEADIMAYKPDVLILVDYPGFNMRVAKFATRQGFRVFYYISPQLWAWRSSRVVNIKRWVEKMFVILPFEEKFYGKYDYKVDYVGHPLLDVINEDMKLQGRQEFLQANQLPDKPLVALLPGSRTMEIQKMLEIMTSARSEFPGYQFVVAGAPSIARDFYSGILRDTGVAVVVNQTYDLLRHSEAALVTSGTATLETALMEVPQVVCYKGNYLSYLIARRIVHVNYISLVNLISDRLLVPELIQDELTRENLARELRAILEPGTVRQNIKDGYRVLKQQLGGRGASERAARLMIQYLDEK